VWFRVKLFLTIIGLFFILTQVSLAQENEELVKEKKECTKFNLGEVVVTATKTERQIGEVPASVSVVTSDDIENSTAHFADETLKTLSGVYLKRSKFMDAVSSVTLRGFSEKSRTLVMLDGQSLNDAYTSGVQWPSIPLDDIERIEVVKGPFSSLYGGNAMGGVINIITKTPKKREIELKSGYGTYHTFSSHLGYTDRFLDERLGLYISIDNKSTNGYRSQPVVKSASSGTGTTAVTGWERTKSSTGSTRYLIGDKGENYWDQWQYVGKIDWDISPDSKLSFHTNISDYKYGYSDPQSYLKDASGNEITSGDVTFDDDGDKKMTLSTKSFLQGESEDKSRLYAFNYSVLLGGGVNAKTKFGIVDNETWYITASTGATKSGGPGKINETDPKRSYRFETQLDIPIQERHTLSVGIGYKYDRVKGEEWNLSDWQDSLTRTTLSTSMQGKQRTESIFTQLELGLHEELKTFLGLRYDHWKNYDGESLASSSTTTYSDKTDSYLSPKIGIVYTPHLSMSEGLWELEKVRFSWGKAFRPPTLYDLYKTWAWYSTTYESNPNLVPENSSSWEIGFENTLFQKKTAASFTYFQSTIEDLIYTKKVSSTLKRKENAGKGEIKGVELEVKQYITEWLDLFGNYTFQDTEITENDAESKSVGKRFTKVPERMYNLGLNMHEGRWNGELTWHWVGKVFSYSDNSDTQEDVYGVYDKVELLDVKLTCAVNENFKVTLSVDNILDRDYYQYYKAPGRTFFTEAAVRF